MTVRPRERVETGIRHEAVFYSGALDQVRVLAPYVREGLDRGEPVLVAVTRERWQPLAEELGELACDVRFVDVRELGANPARMIPAWREFRDRHREGPVRGVAEPAWQGRDADELAEVLLHEALLNLAFGFGDGWRLLCPYDTAALPDAVLEEAIRNHPIVPAGRAGGPAFGGPAHALRCFETPLPSPPDGAQVIGFGRPDLGTLRGLVRRLVQASRLSVDAADDFVLAVHEVATNSVRHGGGAGRLTWWTDTRGVVVDVRDQGRILDPLVGRSQPETAPEDGRGIWMANQLCDLVQVRSGKFGTEVRLFARA